MTSRKTPTHSQNHGTHGFGDFLVITQLMEREKDSRTHVIKPQQSESMQINSTL